MKNELIVTLIAIAGTALGGSAIAQVGERLAAVENQPRLAIASALTTDQARASHMVETPVHMPPCARSTFTELGHGHGDVAAAGYTSAYCRVYEEKPGTVRSQER